MYPLADELRAESWYVELIARLPDSRNDRAF